MAHDATTEPTHATAHYPDRGLVRSPRKLWWNPALEDSEGYEADGGPLLKSGPYEAVNLVSSLCDDGWHSPALDIDYSGLADLAALHAPIQSHLRSVGWTDLAFFMWQRSTNNWHLYLPTVTLSWGDYSAFLDALVDDCQIIEDAYRDHSVERGQTLLRLPGVTKAEEVA